MRLSELEAVVESLLFIAGDAVPLASIAQTIELDQATTRALLDVLESMRAHKIEPKRVRFVQKRGDTAPWLFLAEGHKGGRRFLKVEPPLLIQDEKGGFSPELQRIYRLTPNLSKQK